MRDGLATNIKLHEFLVLDEATGKLFWRERRDCHFRSPKSAAAWNRRYAGKEIGWENPDDGRLFANVDGKRYAIHRIVFAMANGLDMDALPEIVDHRNGGSKDNRPINLRAADPSKNCMNTLTPVQAETGMKGVRKKNGRWYARIQAYGRRTQIGIFDTKEQAFAAYVEAATKVHGEFMRV